MCLDILPCSSSQPHCPQIGGWASEEQQRTLAFITQELGRRALKISYLRNIGATLPCATLRLIRHWGSPTGWRGSPECTLAPDCPPLAWEEAWDNSTHSSLGEAAWKTGTGGWAWVLCPQSSKESLGSTVSCWGFPMPQLCGHTYILLSNFKGLRDTIC